MNYIDADLLKSKLKDQIKERQEWIKNNDGNERQMQLWEDLNLHARMIMQQIDSLKQEAVIPDDAILRHAERDLFGSHQSAAAEEAKSRYHSAYAPECCHLINTQAYVNGLRTAFIEGVIWHENELIKEKKIGKI